MILSVEEVRDLCPGMADEAIKARLDAIEDCIRAYTNNPFQIRAARFSAPSEGSTLAASSAYILAGDTVQISESGVNDGLYVVQSVSENSTVLDRDLFPVDHNLVTKVEYPAAIKGVVRNLLQWERDGRSKVGVKSETLSRYSVTYYDQQSTGSSYVMGYPASLMGGLAPYRKARF